MGAPSGPRRRPVVHDAAGVHVEDGAVQTFDVGIAGQPEGRRDVKAEEGNTQSNQTGADPRASAGVRSGMGHTASIRRDGIEFEQRRATMPRTSRIAGLTPESAP